MSKLMLIWQFLKVRKKTTIALVVRSDTDLAIGDRVEMRTGF